MVFTTDNLPFFFFPLKCYFSLMLLDFEYCFWGTEYFFAELFIITNFARMKFLQPHKISQVYLIFILS